MSQNLVDLHCHILPGIDDGAKNLDVSMTLLRKEVQDGVAGIVFTPHFHYERISVEDFAAKRRAAFLQVAKAAKETGLPLAAKLGAEVYFTTALPSLDLPNQTTFLSNSLPPATPQALTKRCMLCASAAIRRFWPMWSVILS